jgi:hypothetical protein
MYAVLCILVQNRGGDLNVFYVFLVTLDGGFEGPLQMAGCY